MPFQKLEATDVASLARASGLKGDEEGVAELARGLAIVNEWRAILASRPFLAGSEPALVFAPARGPGPGGKK